MNWGTKLIIGMLSFMTFIVVLGVIMIGSKPDPLVDEDYYEKGLNYDQEMKLKEKKEVSDSIPMIQKDINNEQ